MWGPGVVRLGSCWPISTFNHWSHQWDGWVSGCLWLVTDTITFSYWYWKLRGTQEKTDGLTQSQHNYYPQLSGTSEKNVFRSQHFSQLDKDFDKEGSHTGKGCILHLLLLVLHKNLVCRWFVCLKIRSDLLDFYCWARVEPELSPTQTKYKYQVQRKLFIFHDDTEIGRKLKFKFFKLLNFLKSFSEITQNLWEASMHYKQSFFLSASVHCIYRLTTNIEYLYFYQRDIKVFSEFIQKAVYQNMFRSSLLNIVWI